MLTTFSSYFNKIRRQFFRKVENARRPCKRPLEEVSDDEETFTKHSYKPLRKKVCPSRDEPLLPITRKLHFKPTLRWEAQKPPPLAPIEEDEAAKSENIKFLKIKKAIDLREPATRQPSVAHSSSLRPQKQDAAPSTSTRTVEPRQSTYSRQKYEGTNDRKLKTHRSSSVKEKSESWPRKCLGSTNYSSSKKKPLPVTSTRWRPTTISESVRIEEKRQYQQLLLQCTLNKSLSPLSPSHSICQISSSSNSSSPHIHDVRWSRRSSSHSVQSEAESENTLPTSLPTDKLLKCSELENNPSKERESSEDHKRHPSHHKTHKTKIPLSDITMRKEFKNSRMETNESVIRSGSVDADDEKDCSLGQLVKLRYPERKKCNPIPVIDLCHSDSDSIESIMEPDSDSVEIVDEFPHDRRKKTSIVKDLYDRRWMKAMHEEHNNTGQEANIKNKMDEDLESKRRINLSQALHDKVQNRLKQLGIICASQDRCRLPTLSIKKPSFAPLTPEMQAEIDAALIPYPESEVLIHKFNLKITHRDIATLDDLNWLNDQVVNFYLNLIMERSMNNKGLPRVYVFSTFFYPKLFKSGHKSVSRWTKKVDIFTYDILLVPIHLGVHWCMATVDFKERRIAYYDSMLGNNSACLEVLLEYVEAEHLDKRKTSYSTTAWKLESMKNIPEQMNGSDCGVFSCQFAEYKSRQAPLNFAQEDMLYFRRRMVYEIIKAELLE